MPPIGALVAGAAGVASVVLTKAGKKKKVQPTSGNTCTSLAEYLALQVDMHVDIHKGLDMRTTVYLLGYIGVVAIEGSLFKDNIGLLPFEFMMANAIVVLAGVVASLVSLFAGRWMTKARTPEVILQEEKRNMKVSAEERVAVQLSRCESVSQRKRPSSNISLFLLGVLVGSMSFGMPLLAQ